jgi:hypothetical protein
MIGLAQWQVALQQRLGTPVEFTVLSVCNEPFKAVESGSSLGLNLMGALAFMV